MGGKRIAEGWNTKRIADGLQTDGKRIVSKGKSFKKKKIIRRYT